MTPTTSDEPASPPATPSPQSREPGGSTRAPRRAVGTVLRVVELRLRFIALMAVTGLGFGYWDTLASHVEKWRRPPPGTHGVEASLEYFCPMHPSVVLETPAQCPTCGMPLSRRARGGEAALPAGVLSQVRLTAAQVAQAGVKIVTVDYARLDERITTVGTVGFDESRRFQVASSARGRLRVDRLQTSSEGVSVQAGQKLAELYGYDVSQAIRLYLDALGERGPGPSKGPSPAIPGDPHEQVGLAVQGLKVLGVRQEQIDALAADGRSSELLPILAPASGHVIRKAVREGQYVSEGEDLFEIADLSRVWVVGQVFEDQLGRIEVGRRIEAVVPAFPGEAFPGRIALIAPTLDPSSRTAPVRFELDNPGHRLRPGMFATVTLSLAPEGRAPRGPSTCPVSGLGLGSMGRAIAVEMGGRRLLVCCEGCVPKLKSNPSRYLHGSEPSSSDAVLSVPESAVIDTGYRKVVYVETCPGLFEGREVTLGPRSGGDFPVLAGLFPGDRVAAAGAFLIDAESRLNPCDVPSHLRGR